MDRLLSSESRMWRQMRRRRRDGSHWLTFRTPAPLLTVDGKAVAFYEVYHDLTQQLRAEATITEQQKLLEAFFTQSLDGFFFMMLDRPIRWNDQADKEKPCSITSSTHQRITRVNDAMIAEYGMKQSEILGLTPADFIPMIRPTAVRCGASCSTPVGFMRSPTSAGAMEAPMLIEGDYVCSLRCRWPDYGAFRDSAQHQRARPSGGGAPGVGGEVRQGVPLFSSPDDHRDPGGRALHRGERGLPP